MTRKFQPLLIAFLALTTAVSSAFVWRQHRTTRQEQTADDGSRAALERRLAEAERRAHDLENELAMLRSQAEAEPSPSGAPDEPGAPGGEPGRMGRPQQPGQGPQQAPGFMAILDDPEFVRLTSLQEKARLDSRFAPLFKGLLANGTLTPQQLDAFKDLLVEKQNAARDARIAARANGVRNRPEITQLVSEAQAEVDRQIRSTYGDAAFNAYHEYEKTLRERTTVNQLAQPLSYSSTPLTDLQAQQLVNILSQTDPQAGTNVRGNTRVTDEAINLAKGVLAPAQLDALINLQQLQRSEEELRNRIRELRRQNMPTKTSARK